MKFLLLLAVIAVVWWLMAGRSARTQAVRAARKPAPPRIEPMVRCAHCGVHLPRGEALALEGAEAGDDTQPWFCSPAHRAAGVVRSQ
jgi:uncharacterized protein